MENILYAVLWFFLLGGVLGLVLALLNQKLAVKEDLRKEKIVSLLPGANCGGCGFAGCAGLADAILEGKAHPSACGSLEQEGMDEICSLMGLETVTAERMIAHVTCSGGGKAKEKYIYEGIRDCRIAAGLGGGNKMCPNGCTGLGNCERVCEFDALHLVDGVATVDPMRCRGCRACANACPKHLIEMIPATARYAVSCISRQKGAQVMKVCESGCIGCKKCEKVCEVGAIRVENFVASIDQTLCTACGKCAEACPRGTVRRVS